MRQNKAVGGISYPSNRKGFIYALARRESSADLNKDDIFNKDPLRITNSFGYVGLFQYGTPALIDIGYKTKDGAWTGKNGATSIEAFKASRKIQIAAISLSIDLWCKRLRTTGLNEYYGKIIKGVEITESGCIAGCHLVGLGGLASFLNVPSALKINKSTGKPHKESDGNNIHISHYIELFAGYDLETCCERKVRIKLKEPSGLPLEDKPVKILSTYSGKYPNSRFEVTHKTDQDGELPVIVRHPGAKITLEIDGRQSEEITQSADQKQPYSIITSDLKISAPLAAKGTPKPKEQKAEQQTEGHTNPQSESTDSKDINFNIAILEGDSKKPISNVKFTLVYKGNPKQHVTGGQGVKENIVAEVGQNVQVCMAGEGSLQPIMSFTVTESLRDTTVQVPLPVHIFSIVVVNTQGSPVPNAEFSVFYRNKERIRKTDGEGRLKIKALVGFVYGFGNKGNPLLHQRCLQSVSIRKIIVNPTAVQIAQSSLGQAAVTKATQAVQQAVTGAAKPSLPSKTGNQQSKPTEKQKTEPTKPTKPTKPKQEPPLEQKNTHTEKGGKALTVVGDRNESKEKKQQGKLPSGVEWVKKFPNNNSLDALKEPFKSHFKKFLAALKEAGISVSIAAVYRPPQRSYLMFYAKAISDNKIYPNEVPKFSEIKKNVGSPNDEDVNIDWECGGNERLARIQAQKMKNAYGIGANPVGRPYQSNHNKGLAVDMKLSPAWGIGKKVKTASGELREIKSKKDIVEVGKTYQVFHWTSNPKKRSDDPHWSWNGN